LMSLNAAFFIYAQAQRISWINGHYLIISLQYSDWQ
jgi:hypothetical protein